MKALRDRLAELVDLEGLDMLATWDQLVMMPSDGAPNRAHQLGTLARVRHERATATEIGAWLDQLEERDLEGIDRDIVRLARRDWERAGRVPTALAAQRSSAHAEAQQCWQRARERDDFAEFAPALERNVELARAYGECLAEDGRTYDALLDDHDFGLRSEELRRLFATLAQELPRLVAAGRERARAPALPVPALAQRRAVDATLAKLGVERASWRVDVSAHPFTAWIGRGDTRLTTRYGELIERPRRRRINSQP